MKSLFLSFSISLSLLFLQVQPNIFQQLSDHEKIPPAYAKWGLLAVKKTNEKYPHAQIIDYLHQGREDHPDHTVEKFKLWLKGEEREFGVFVDITFNVQTEEVLEITFTETDH